MPCSKSVSGGRNFKRSAIWPKAVPAPVWTIRAWAVPLRTLVPIKTQLVRAAKPAVAATSSALCATFFSTGKVSPVSTAWLTKKSLATSKTPSAGIRLPAASSTTSPGTTAAAGIVWGWPSRSTVALIVTRACNFATAVLARYSCQKPSRELPRMINRIMVASIHSWAKAETITAKTKIRTRGLLN